MLAQAAGQRHREAGGQPGDHDREEHADRQRGAGVLEGRAHARGRAALAGRDAPHDRGGVGRGEHPAADPIQRDEQREGRVGEADRQQHQADEAAAEDRHPGGRDATGPELVGQEAPRPAPKPGTRR